MEEFDDKKAKLPKMKKYRVNAAIIARWPMLATQIAGKSVALAAADVIIERAGNAQHPPEKITVKAATQEQLKYLFETEKHPFIEEYEG